MITEIGNKTFKTKKEAHSFIADIIKNSGIEKIERGDDLFFFFKELVIRHPECEKRNLHDVSKFIIKENKTFWHKELSVVVGDKEEVISWNKCLNEKDHTYKEKLLRAMREKISDQIIGFKYYKGKHLMCHICEKEITGDFHADHVVSFKCLADIFIEKNKTRSIEIEECDKSHTNRFKKDNMFGNMWEKFHRENAMLKASHPECNLKKKK